MKFLIAVLAVVAYVSADVAHILGQDANAQILNQESVVGVDGQYQWAYETANGIEANAQGALKNVPGAEAPAQIVQGRAKWTAPDGQVIELQYSADENGYQAQGPHIPTPHPIPEAILRSIEFIKANPPKEA